MSKSLNAKILANINRRETEKAKKAEEAEKAKIDLTKEWILSDLKNALESCLEKFESYSYHWVNANSPIPYKFEESAKELGFNLLHYKDNNLYDVSVIPFKKGEKRTPAQLILYKFERELAKKRKERKTKLLVECKHIKQEIEAGNFEYSIIYDEKEIYVETTETFETDFEKDVIYSFFSKYNLRFKKDTSKFTLVVSEK